jgi:hypothetical protein
MTRTVSIDHRIISASVGKADVEYLHVNGISPSVFVRAAIVAHREGKFTHILPKPDGDDT